MKRRYRSAAVCAAAGALIFNDMTDSSEAVTVNIPLRQYKTFFMTIITDAKH